MSFSSITDVKQELFHFSASHKSNKEVSIQKQVRFDDTDLRDIELKMTPKSVSNNLISSNNCDKNSNNNHHASVVSEESKLSSSSLRSFGSQIDSTLRGSDYLENARQHQHNYQQKQEHQSLNHHQQPPQQPEFQVWYAVQFRRLCQLCLVMPLIGLVGCLLVACAFQFGDIQETACKVYNLVPSISAITGISPGRYLWRVCIAFHLGPRLLIVATYYHFLLSFAPSLTTKGSAHKLSSLLNYCFYLQIIEILSLCTISFIHNREHYPIHQKGFIFYICSSHLSFLLILKIYHVIWPALNDLQKCSYRNKLGLLILSLTCMFIMAYFYYRHFIHCDPFAFSIFAFAEYIVAVANMGYYWTIVDDLPTEQIVVMRPGNFPSRISTPSANDVIEEKSSNYRKEGNGTGSDYDGTTKKTEIDQRFTQSETNKNLNGEKESLPNGFEGGLKNRSNALSSDVHHNTNEASAKPITDGKVNGYVARPEEASITNKTHASNGKNKHE